VRIDICARGGKYVKPYYLLLKRVGRDRKSLRVHRHTIPVFIPLRQLEERYLPVPTATSRTGENDILKPSKQKKQDLKKLVRELRRELVSWHLRSDAVDLLREELGLPKNSSEDDAASTVSDNQEPGPVAQKSGILSLAATSIEARYIRIEWSDGRVGRIKISNQGFVERAIIIGDDGKDDITASLCTGGDGRIETLLQRLLDAQRPD
jgi:central kinetochore subunit Mal2/MCM21